MRPLTFSGGNVTGHLITVVGILFCVNILQNGVPLIAQISSGFIIPSFSNVRLSLGRLFFKSLSIKSKIPYFPGLVPVDAALHATGVSGGIVVSNSVKVSKLLKFGSLLISLLIIFGSNESIPIIRTLFFIYHSFFFLLSFEKNLLIGLQKCFIKKAPIVEKKTIINGH